MRARLILSVVVGVLIGGVAAITVFPEFRDRLFAPMNSTTSGKALVGGPFALTDQNGKKVTDQDFRGQYMLVFFGFTNCPDICPAGLQLISAALDELGPKASKVTPIFVSVDPERDTQEKLAAYVKNFND
ncbi:MAG: SCO family protein, partial [Hyphomicrobium sp.]